MSNPTPQYSLFILTRNEGDNLKVLLPVVHEVLQGLQVSYEIVIVDGASKDDTVAVAEAHGVKVVQQQGRGYGAAFREGLALCRGEWIMTIDADHSHPPQFLRAMIANCEGADMLIASRYVPGGAAMMDMWRAALSWILNTVFGVTLGIPVKDLSSGFRMYRRAALQGLQLEGRDFDVLIETLVRLVSAGYRVREIPFIYEPRVFGTSNARVFKFGLSYIRMLIKMWRLRNSTDSADYDERAYNSLIPPQRWWHRRRVAIVLSLVDKNLVTLDIGCGSSRITRLISRAIGMDIAPGPLRFLKARGVATMEGSLQKIPLADKSVDQVILNEVIQQIPRESLSLAEVRRVLRPGGVLVISTPNPESVLWQRLEKIHRWLLPEAPSTKYQAQYSRSEVISWLGKEGFAVEQETSIFDADLFFKAKMQ